MIREVDLVSYLPPFMQSYKEPVAALEAENPEFSLMWSATDRCLRNRFISTADEYGISQPLMIPLNQGVQGFKASGSTQSRTLGKCCFKSCLSFAVTVILK